MGVKQKLYMFSFDKIFKVSINSLEPGDNVPLNYR